MECLEPSDCFPRLTPFLGASGWGSPTCRLCLPLASGSESLSSRSGQYPSLSWYDLVPFTLWSVTGLAHSLSLAEPFRDSLSEARRSSVVRTKLMVASLKDLPKCSMADLRKLLLSKAWFDASWSLGVWQELSFWATNFSRRPLDLATHARSWSSLPLLWDEWPWSAACRANGLPVGFTDSAELPEWLVEDSRPLERSSLRPRPCSWGFPWPSPSPACSVTLPLLSGQSGPLPDFEPGFPFARLVDLGIFSFRVILGGGRNSILSAGYEEGRPDGKERQKHVQDSATIQISRLNIYWQAEAWQMAHQQRAPGSRASHASWTSAPGIYSVTASASPAGSPCNINSSPAEWEKRKRSNTVH